MDWLRWWHGTVNDPKFQRVARMAGASAGEVIAVWACLLERASSVTQRDAAVTRGSVTGFDCDDHDVLLGFEEGRTARIIAALVDRGLIVDGRIARWDERQPKREDSSAARTRAYREKKRATQAVTQGDAQVTQSNASETHGDAPDTDTDTEKSNNPLSPPSGDTGPQRKPATKKPGRSKPKRPIPEPFMASLDLLRWASERVPAVNTDLETERFVNYWLAEGKAKADWDSTWRNWMLKAQADAEQGIGRRRPSGRTDIPDFNDTDWANEDNGL